MTLSPYLVHTKSRLPLGVAIYLKPKRFQLEVQLKELNVVISPNHVLMGISAVGTCKENQIKALGRLSR